MTDDLNNLSVEELGLLFPIKIVDYDPRWPDLYLQEKKIIIGTVGLSNISRIEHIGSTAIPGLCAKPTIDILLEIQESANPELLIERLERISYNYIPKPENPPPHMMFAKGYSIKGFTGQTYHVHIRYHGDWDEILFRDYLIDNQNTAQEYAGLKKRLAKEFRNDREKYTDNKSLFIKSVVQQARGLI